MTAGAWRSRRARRARRCWTRPFDSSASTCGTQRDGARTRTERCTLKRTCGSFVALRLPHVMTGVPIVHRRLTARDPSATVCSPRSVSLADVESSRRTRAGATGCSRKRPRRECVSASLCVGNPVVASDRTTPGCACPADTCLTWRASIGPGTQTCCSQWATRRVAARPLVATCCIAEWAYVAHEINGQNLER
jgi:hypothetical protein